MYLRKDDDKLLEKHKTILCKIKDSIYIYIYIYIFIFIYNVYIFIYIYIYIYILNWMFTSL